ncbi:MAG: DUF454 family protein, partial [Planctomycetota bacterium]
MGARPQPETEPERSIPNAERSGSDSSAAQRPTSASTAVDAPHSAVVTFANDGGLQSSSSSPPVHAPMPQDAAKGESPSAGGTDPMPADRASQRSVDRELCPPPTKREHLIRAVLVMTGVASVGLAWLGAVLPGLPTTIFLIIAAACFAKSCPWLEDRLIRNRLFRPYLKYIDGQEPMP